MTFHKMGTHGVVVLGLSLDSPKKINHFIVIPIGNYNKVH